MSNTGTEVLSHISTEVEQRFAGFDDLAHGWEHVQRVYHLALHIAEQEGANRFIVGMAAQPDPAPPQKDEARDELQAEGEGNEQAA